MLGFKRRDLDEALNPFGKALRECLPGKGPGEAGRVVGPASQLCSVLGSASLSAKRQNEDAHLVYRGQSMNAVAVADGVGSAVDSHLASRAAVHAFMQAVRELDEKRGTASVADIRCCWTEAGSAIRGLYDSRRSFYMDERSVLQTTLITAVETRDCFIVGHLGNGSLFLVRGDFSTFLPRRFPWCFTDLATGHSRLGDNGQEILFAVLHPRTDVGAVHLMRIEKDRQLGEIFILTTDGVSSPDHQAIGNDGQGRRWLELNANIERLVSQDLPGIVRSAAANGSKTDMEQDLQEYLAGASYDDDATIAVLISRAAIQFTYRSGREEALCKST